jgi:tRNA pseudouridine55 synthase
MKDPESGVLNVAKSAGMTSRDVVDRVEDRFPRAKIGHGGTLDRAATGVLPLLFNEATKLVPYLQMQPKTYQATFRYDRFSETLDTDGDMETIQPEHRPDRDDVLDVLNQFQGKIEQVPPRYSALKKDGRRLAERVEQGEDVEPDPRTVRCHEVGLIEFDFPTLEIEITCGKGFYVRSLARDLGRALDLDGGVVDQLRRVTYGSLSLGEAINLENDHWEEGWFPPLKAVESFYRVTCGPDQLESVHHGDWLPRDTDDHDWATAVDRDGRLHAMLRATEERGRPEWHPKRVLNRDRAPEPVD